MNNSQRMLPSFSVCCSDLISKWENLAGSKGWCELDVGPELQSFSGDVISQVAFGSSCEEILQICQLQAEQNVLFMQSFKYLYIPGYRFAARC